MVCKWTTWTSKILLLPTTFLPSTKPAIIMSLFASHFMTLSTLSSFSSHYVICNLRTSQINLFFTPLFVVLLPVKGQSRIVSHHARKSESILSERDCIEKLVIRLPNQIEMKGTGIINGCGIEERRNQCARNCVRLLTNYKTER